MSVPPLTPLFPAAPPSSNLLQYRALFQVFTYARVKRQSAEHLVRDAMTGGVVVPFNLPVAAEDSTPALSALTTAEQPLPMDETRLLSPPTPSMLLLLPSSKSIATLASLLADGFFNIAPLASTVEKMRGTTYRLQSECEPRDLFTLIALLFPDCCVAEDLPRALLALRRGESASVPVLASSRGDSERATPSTLHHHSPVDSLHASRSGRSPPAQGGHSLFKLGEEEGDSLTASRSGAPSALPRLPSPTRSAASEPALDPAPSENTSATNAAASGKGMLPEVDPVPLSVEGVHELLTCRRSLATVLLASLNEALRDVQYREMERARPSTTEAAALASSSSPSEAAALQLASEVLLTAKVLLMAVMAASEVWWRRRRQQQQHTEGGYGVRTERGVSSPYTVLYELLEADNGAAVLFTAVPVEEWVWGKDKEATALWYDRLLDHILQSTEAAGLQLDAFMNTSKSIATQRGTALSHAPTLLLHRPSDGHPAVELHFSFLDRLNCAVALPVMPLQPGELHLLLHPVGERTTRGGVVTTSRDHELLFDATASPTAEFLQSCATTACPSAMLQSSGVSLPPLLRMRFAELPASDRGIVKAFLSDPQQLGGVLEKNAAMLARLTLWAEGQWAPSNATPNRRLAKTTVEHEPACVGPATTEDGYELAADIKSAVMFRRPFSAAVGRFVREMIVLNGFDQMTLETWIRHICADLAQEGAFTMHRAALSALVKFAALQRRWTWTSEVGDLQKQFLP